MSCLASVGARAVKTPQGRTARPLQDALSGSRGFSLSRTWRYQGGHQNTANVKIREGASSGPSNSKGSHQLPRRPRSGSSARPRRSAVRPPVRPVRPPSTSQRPSSAVRSPQPRVPRPPAQDEATALLEDLKQSCCHMYPDLIQQWMHHHCRGLSGPRWIFYNFPNQPDIDWSWFRARMPSLASDRAKGDPFIRGLETFYQMVKCSPRPEQVQEALMYLFMWWGADFSRWRHAGEVLPLLDQSLHVGSPDKGHLTIPLRYLAKLAVELLEQGYLAKVLLRWTTEHLSASSDGDFLAYLCMRNIDSRAVELRTPALHALEWSQESAHQRSAAGHALVLLGSMHSPECWSTHPVREQTFQHLESLKPETFHHMPAQELSLVVHSLVMHKLDVSGATSAKDCPDVLRKWLDGLAVKGFLSHPEFSQKMHSVLLRSFLSPRADGDLQPQQILQAIDQISGLHVQLQPGPETAVWALRAVLGHDLSLVWSSDRMFLNAPQEVAATPLHRLQVAATFLSRLMAEPWTDASVYGPLASAYLRSGSPSLAKAMDAYAKIRAEQIRRAKATNGTADDLNAGICKFADDLLSTRQWDITTGDSPAGLKARRALQKLSMDLLTDDIGPQPHHSATNGRIALALIGSLDEPEALTFWNQIKSRENLKGSRLPKDPSKKLWRPGYLIQAAFGIDCGTQSLSRERIVEFFCTAEPQKRPPLRLELITQVLEHVADGTEAVSASYWMMLFFLIAKTYGSADPIGEQRLVQDRVASAGVIPKIDRCLAAYRRIYAKEMNGYHRLRTFTSCFAAAMEALNRCGQPQAVFDLWDELALTAWSESASVQAASDRRHLYSLDSALLMTMLDVCGHNGQESRGRKAWELATRLDERLYNQYSVNARMADYNEPLRNLNSWHSWVEFLCRCGREVEAFTELYALQNAGLRQKELFDAVTRSKARLPEARLYKYWSPPLPVNPDPRKVPWAPIEVTPLLLGKIFVPRHGATRRLASRLRGAFYSNPTLRQDAFSRIKRGDFGPGMWDRLIADAPIFLEWDADQIKG